VTRLGHKNSVIANGKRTAGRRDVRLVSSASTISRRSILAAPANPDGQGFAAFARIVRGIDGGQEDSDGAEYQGAAADAADQDPAGFAVNSNG